MNKIQKATLALGSICIGAAAYAGLAHIQSLGFIAPSIIGRTNIYQPVSGEIVYDQDAAQFYGHDHLGNWLLLSSIQTPNPVGSVIAYAGSTAPSEWLLCDGSSVSTTTYSDLFAVIGYTYGGSGVNFNLPNTQGVFVRGAGSQTLSGVTY